MTLMIMVGNNACWNTGQKKETEPILNSASHDQILHLVIFKSLVTCYQATTFEGGPLLSDRLNQVSAT